MNLTEEERKLRIKQFKEELERRKQKKKGKKEEKKEEKKDKKYPYCINDKDYTTLDDVNDIPERELVRIHYLGKIHCLDSSTFINSLKHPQETYVKKKVRGRYVFSLIWLYQLPLSFTIDYLESNRDKILTVASKGARDFILKKSKSKYEGVIRRLNIMSIQALKKEDLKKIEEEKKKPEEKKKKYTVKELKKMCKDKKIKGYSKLKKVELLKKCLSKENNGKKKSEEKKKKYTVKELRKMCKDNKIKGYSKLKKEELLKKCL